MKKLGSRELLDFILGQEQKVQQRLFCSTDPARVVSLLRFQQFMLGFPEELPRVAVISGTLEEPELSFLALQDVEILAYEEDPVLFDLNSDWTGKEWDSYRGAYDMVLCNQVLEHVKNPELAVRNLVELLAPRGVLYLSFPTINNRHGEPDFYYAGFSVELVGQWGLTEGLVILDSSEWTSRKGAKMYSVCDWSPLAVSGPMVFFAAAILGGFLSVPQFWKFLKDRLRHAVEYPLQNLFHQPDRKSAVCAWVFLQNPEK